MPNLYVDVNTASFEQLRKLPGIGFQSAELITQARKEHGVLTEAIWRRIEISKEGLMEKLLVEKDVIFVVPGPGEVGRHSEGRDENHSDEEESDATITLSNLSAVGIDSMLEGKTGHVARIEPGKLEIATSSTKLDLNDSMSGFSRDFDELSIQDVGAPVNIDQVCVDFENIRKEMENKQFLEYRDIVTCMCIRGWKGTIKDRSRCR